MTEDNKNEDLDARLLGQMLQDFLEESQENLDQLNLSLTRLEGTPEDQELVNEIFRIAHTMKGTSGFVGLDRIEKISHKMEDVFGAVRKGACRVTAELVDVMFEALEVLTLVRDKAVANDPIEVDISWIIQKLEQALNRESEVRDKKEIPLSSDKDIGGKNPDPWIGPEVSADGRDAFNAAKGQIQTPTPTAKKTILSMETIRVPTKKLDSLMNLVGELITGRNRLNEFSEQLKNDDLERIASSIDRLTGQLYSGIMSVRMVPIDRLFIKFPGVVRNLARERNKEVDLRIEGKETELDKTIIEQIYDPLVHLLRNAVDHGIETAEVREQKDKSRAGQIRLVSWHQENMVIIEISDDGQGIDPERMRTAAVQKDLLNREEASILSDEEAVRLIFAPGFSTAHKVTDVSGRGVGMDVVKENVQKLRGIVDVRTALDKGTTFQIQIPLTMAVLKVLLVKSGGRTYALPIHTVIETLLIDSKEIKTLKKNEVLFIRNQALPFRKLSTIFNFDSNTDSNNGYLSVVVVGLAEQRVALCVDELLDKQEVVVKNVGNYLGRVEGIEGAAILTDGSVTLIVDVEAALT